LIGGRWLKPIAVTAAIGGVVLAWVKRTREWEVERRRTPLDVNEPSSTTQTKDAVAPEGRAVATDEARPAPAKGLPTTKEGLYELAKQRDIPGRSKMSKAALRRALMEPD
jgi:hypothetical protein